MIFLEITVIFGTIDNKLPILQVKKCAHLAHFWNYSRPIPD